jgi:hypothetical protein
MCYESVIVVDTSQSGGVNLILSHNEMKLPMIKFSRVKMCCPFCLQYGPPRPMRPGMPPPGYDFDMRPPMDGHRPPHPVDNGPPRGPPFNGPGPRFGQAPGAGGIRFQIPKRNNMNQGPNFHNGPANRGRGGRGGGPSHPQPQGPPPTQNKPFGGKPGDRGESPPKRDQKSPSSGTSGLSPHPNRG